MSLPVQGVGPAIKTVASTESLAGLARVGVAPSVLGGSARRRVGRRIQLPEVEVARGGLDGVVDDGACGCGLSLSPSHW